MWRNVRYVPAKKRNAAHRPERAGVWCEEHQRSIQPETRPNSYRRGYGRRWQRERREYLTEHPWCAECEKHEIREPAIEVDHIIIPHKGNHHLFWDPENRQGLCHRCHSRKTAREDGGFGRRPDSGAGR